jgi:hypothetical protein
MLDEVEKHPDQFTIMSDAHDWQFDTDNTIQPFD